MRQRLKRIIIVGMGILFAAAALLFALIREPMEDLTESNLEAARVRWQAAGIVDYRWRYKMAGGVYSVRVVGKRVTSLTRDGIAATSATPDDFSVEGVFDILQRELDMLQDPNSPLGGDRGTTMLRVRFHPTLGHVERYLRAVGGSGRSSGIESILLEPTSRPH